MAGIVIGALVVGVGFSLAVDAIRDDEPVGQPPSAAPATVRPSEVPETASPLPSATTTASVSPTDTPTPAPTATVSVTTTPSPSPTVAASPTPTAAARGCDVVTVDGSGTLYVNGEAVPGDPWEAEYGEQMPTAVLRLAVRASSASGAEVCLDVELPKVTVTGELEICGDVTADRQAPMETPPPPQPAPTQPLSYGLPSIDGVVISDRMLDINSYPLLDIADVEDVPVCLLVEADANDVQVTLSLAICASAQLDAGGVLRIFDGDMEWSFEPADLVDEDDALAVGAPPVEAGLDIRNHLDDVIHLIEMRVRVVAECPEADR